MRHRAPLLRWRCVDHTAAVLLLGWNFDMIRTILTFLIALTAALLVDLHSPIRFGLLRCLASLSSLVQGRATNAVFAAAAAR